MINFLVPPFARLYPNDSWDVSKIPELTGKVAIVTGGNTGLGLQTCRLLAAHGALVFVAARSKEKGEAAVKAIRAETGNENVELLELDLANIKSTQSSALAFLSTGHKVDILVNNAGVLDAEFTLTPRDRIESHFAINHLGHFVFTNTLLPALQKGARIVNVTSYAQINAKPPTPILFDKINEKDAFGDWLARYSQSKLANVLFTRSLQSRLGPEYYVNCCHPGQVGTELNRTVTQSGIQGYIIRLLMLLFDQPAEVGALTQLYLATGPEVVEKDIHGEYFVSIARRSMDFINPVALDEHLAEELWTFSQRLVDEKLAA